MSLNLHTLDPAEVLPLPEVPESYGPRNEEEARILARVKEGLESGPAIPVDRAFFERLRSRVSLIVKSSRGASSARVLSKLAALLLYRRRG